MHYQFILASNNLMFPNVCKTGIWYTLKTADIQSKETMNMCTNCANKAV
jgi:hypothetical protein